MEVALTPLNIPLLCLSFQQTDRTRLDAGGGEAVPDRLGWHYVGGRGGVTSSTGRPQCETPHKTAPLNEFTSV